MRHSGLFFKQVQNIQIFVQLIEGLMQDVFFENACSYHGKRVLQEVEERNGHFVEYFVVINLLAQVNFEVVVEDRSDEESEEKDEDSEPGEEVS